MAAAGAGDRGPGPESASVGEGGPPRGPRSHHSLVPGSGLLPPQHHHEVAEGQAAAGHRGCAAWGRAAQRGWHLPGLDGFVGATWGRAETHLPGGASGPGAAPRGHLGAPKVGHPGRWSHQRDRRWCHHLRWNFVQNPPEKAGFRRRSRGGLHSGQRRMRCSLQAPVGDTA